MHQNAVGRIKSRASVAIDPGDADLCLPDRLDVISLVRKLGRPYRKNDQAWIEQTPGAVVRKLLEYHHSAGIAAARAITRLYASSRLFVGFLQPSFKLAAKHREGARVSKCYYPPQTPCERLLHADIRR